MLHVALFEYERGIACHISASFFPFGVEGALLLGVVFIIYRDEFYLLDWIGFFALHLIVQLQRLSCLLSHHVVQLTSMEFVGVGEIRG